MRPARTVLPIMLAIGAVGLGMLLGPVLAERIAYAVERGQHSASQAELAELSQKDNLSALFRAVTKAVKPAVVVVRVTKQIEQRDPGDFLERFDDEDFPFPFRIPRRRGRRRHYYRQEGIGSGVIVDAANGYIVTNHHVVGGADEVEIILHNGKKYEAQWVRTDPQTDVAVVKIEPDHLIDAPLGDSDQVEVGDWVLAIGAPHRLPQTVTAGIISAKGRYNVRDPSMYQNLIQTDAAINRGNSGGPLVNMKGQVIGINNMISVSSAFSGNEGIGFAIPSNMVKEIMDQLVGEGKVVRGYLGVYIQDVDPAQAESMGLPEGTKGAVVVTVLEDSPAERAGLKIEDVIVKVNGKTTSNVNDLRNVIASIKPGTKVDVVIYRDGKKMTVQVETGKQPDEMTARWRRQGGERKSLAARKLGIDVAELTRDRAQEYGYDDPPEGVIILWVKEGSEAEEKGLREGMVITHVQGDKVESVDDFEEILERVKPRQDVRLRVTDPTGGAKLVFLKQPKED